MLDQECQCRNRLFRIDKLHTFTSDLQLPVNAPDPMLNSANPPAKISSRLDLAREGHPAAAEGISMAAFKNAGHVVAEARGTGHFYLLEQNFEALGIDRKIKVRVPNFMSIPNIVAETDLLATIPRAFCPALKDSPISVLGYEHPVKLPSIDVKLL
ncbi:hypothetical protein [Aurantiacibacter atlanticus]|uniref:hypothetical protein n=1 Tax=Aurantiacibacter atlanticus TaxID=1648404 RepID=UPI00065F409A|nr:hypothetical protein [Aurantiacibacter atlanticus]